MIMILCLDDRSLTLEMQDAKDKSSVNQPSVSLQSLFCFVKLIEIIDEFSMK